jgi:aliphatic nitrilase
MTVIRAAAVQISPVLYSRDGTVERVVAKIDELAYEGVQFATFPETLVPYHPYCSFVQPPFELGVKQLQLMDQAVTVPSPATDGIADAARRAGMVVAIGVNERDGGTLYNTQLLFDADGALLQRRRKITPRYYERMIWGQGDGSGLHAVDSAVGRIGQLACWEHYNPLARYALTSDGEQIHSAMFRSFGGQLFPEQPRSVIKMLSSHAPSSNATARLNPDQQGR